MQDIDLEQRLLNIIEYAHTAEHLKFEFIRSWRQYRFYRNKSKFLAWLIKMLTRSTNRVFKSYCKSIKTGTADFSKLLAYQQLQSVISFYKEELTTMQDMTDEYESYLFYGYYTWTLMGIDRPEECLWDFRNKR